MRPHPRFLLLAVTAVALAAIGLFAWSRWHRQRRGSPESPAALATVRPSDATYVGAAACAECHAEIYDAYQSTLHRRAFREADPALDPSDEEFDHPASQRSYGVVREGGGIRHRESVAGNDGAPIVLCDYRVRYVVGSGQHARTYLVERDGVLTESPITWYALPEKWGMSPGYDLPVHRGFERPVFAECLWCHAGRVERIDGEARRFRVVEQSIDCERCHGPGGRHVALRREENEASEPIEDDSIVNPRRLDRERRAAICLQCHLSPASEAEVSGRSRLDFRPGELWQDYVVPYGVEGRDAPTTIAGHGEQLRASRCYRESATLTCTSCHDPHRPVAIEERTAAYRKKCLECHRESSCRMPADIRAVRSSRGADDCVACHMPQTGTDVVHVASTQHRIGIYQEARELETSSGDRMLVPLMDVSRLSAVEQDRCLGLAYLAFARNPPSSARAAQSRLRRAKSLLERAEGEGRRDGAVLAALAEIELDLGQHNAALRHARESLADPAIRPASRNAALWIEARIALSRRQSATACAALETLVASDPNSTHFLALAETYRRLGRLEDAVLWAQRAVAVNGSRIDARRMLSNLLLQSGDRERAEAERAAASWLERRLPAGSP
jgi:hypothetical protein